MPNIRPSKNREISALKLCRARLGLVKSRACAALCGRAKIALPGDGAKLKTMTYRSSIITPQVGIGALLVGCAPVCWQQISLAKDTKEMFVNSGDLTSFGQTRPIQDLRQAIAKHKNSALFRVTWYSRGTLGGTYSVILYNRQRHTLKYYHSADWLVSDDEPVIRETSSEAVLYTGVQDSMMPRLLKVFDQLKEIDKSSTDADSLFPKLVKFGAKKRQISATNRRYTFKQGVRVPVARD